MDAATAEKFGLVSRVVPEDELLDRAVEMAGKIASFSKPIGTATVTYYREVSLTYVSCSR
jgi:enoyl-CoA hydratase/carnithine racemase